MTDSQSVYCKAQTCVLNDRMLILFLFFSENGSSENEGGVGQRDPVPHPAGRVRHQVQGPVGAQGNSRPEAQAVRRGPEGVHLEEVRFHCQQLQLQRKFSHGETWKICFVDSSKENSRKSLRFVV